MVKRILAVVVLGLALPVLANAAWFFNTQAKTSGGSLSSRNMAGQRSGSGSIFKSYTTQGSLGVTVAADTGYSIRSVVLNGAELGPQTSPFSTAVQGPNAQSVLVSFAPVPIQVSAQVTTGGGTVTPASYGPVVYGTKLSAPLNFYFTPQSSYNVATLSGATGATVSPAVPGAAGQQVKVTYPAGYVFTAPIALSASFASSKPVASAGLPQTALAGQAVTLKAANIGSDFPTSFTWSYLSGPANQPGPTLGTIIPGPPVTLTQSGSNASLVAPATPGTYIFQVALTGGSTATTSVIVSDSLLASSRSQCQFCHTGNNVGSAQLFNNWSASKHKAQKISCDGCHQGAGSGGHPGTVTSGTVSPASYNFVATGVNFCASCHSANVTRYQGSRHKLMGVGCAACHSNAHNPAVAANVCDSCHLDQSGQVANHPIDMGGNACVSCHNPHDLNATVSGLPAVHYNNLTGAHYPASYMSSRATCSDCHHSGAQNLSVRQQWYTSGHARVTAQAFSYYDFKTMSGCVQCHTTTGFVAFSSAKVTAAWGVASDKTKEVITCVACHKDSATGTLRSVTPSRPYQGENYQNRNVGASNICVDCHSGLNTGKAIQAQVAAQADFGNLPFIAPHYKTAAGSLHGRTGYQFSGQSYAFYSSNSHRLIGLGNAFNTGTLGPCIACHKGTGGSHGFKAGVTDLCSNCHGAGMTAQAFADGQSNFQSGLKVLGALLTDKGFSYTGYYPYFANTNWGTGQAGADTMGVAYNYTLLLKEPGAFVHNPAYAKQLIFDSIDYLGNGTVTGDISGVLTYLVGKNAISQADVDALTRYKESSSCTSCHQANTGSHSAHLSRNIGCASCHASTAASNTTLVPGSTTHANGVVNVVLAGGGSYANGSCSGVACHSNGAGVTQSVVWGSKLTCLSCHPVLGGSHPAHVGNLLTAAFSSYTGNYSTAASYRFGCANCHPVDLVGHQNGKIDLDLSAVAAAGTLRSKNDPNTNNLGINQAGSGITGNSRTSVVCSASYCHSNGWNNGSLTYAASPDWYNPGAYTGDRCAMCHSNSPNSSTPGSSAHTVHTVGIHALNVFSGTFGNLTTGATGNVGHGNAAQSTTLNCNMCHNATVASFRNDMNNACLGCHQGQGNALTVADKTMHVNGHADVSFANISVVSKAQLRPASFALYSANLWTRNGGNYKNGPQAFDSSKTKLKNAASFTDGTCSNVACHMGKPVQWTDTNSPSYCALCHTAL